MKKINDFVILTDEFDCIEIFDLCTKESIQMTLEEAELVLANLSEEIKYIKG